VLVDVEVAAEVDVDVLVDSEIDVLLLVDLDFEVIRYVEIYVKMLGDFEDDWDVHVYYDVELCLCASSGRC
jgi:hypothetical protein